MAEQQPDDLVILTRVPTEFEASAIVGELKNHGIDVSMTGGFTAAFLAEGPGDVQLVVRKQDYDRAAKLLETMEVENQEIDWSQVDVGDPEE